ncbi:MAG: Fic family protein [Rickettsiales bacterium]
MYLYEHKEWPNFTWDQNAISPKLAEVRLFQGKLLGKMQSLGFDLQEEATLSMLTDDVVKTSEIEGESLNKTLVRSSIANKLGIDTEQEYKVDRNIEGIVQIMLDATTNYLRPLTEDRLFDWHAALFPTGRSGIFKITVGGWRNEETGVMQVVSGAIGREKVHFEAPKHEGIPQEMKKFLEWFNQNNDLDLVLKSAIAHLWFVTIHPFSDGNGRICRALSDMLLAKSEDSSRRFYSMSSQIQKDRKNYYLNLEETQKDDLDISEWILWYLSTLKDAITNSESVLENIINKARFWQINYNIDFNERQRKILNKLLDHFEGNLTSSKWAKICRCSQDTAGRDIKDLLDKNILRKSKSSGRSTHYILV